MTWDETAEKFRKVTDRLGMPIDDGIFDTVVALNILGVTTRMSCEGHLDHGLSYPWIDIGLPDPTNYDTPEIAQMREDIRPIRPADEIYNAKPSYRHLVTSRSISAGPSEWGIYPRIPLC
jgi:hypothetical protein